MKSAYLSGHGEQYFQTSPTGERLFLHNSVFWSKPYIVPDEETEKRLHKKQLLMLKIFWGIALVVQSFLLAAMPSIVRMPLWFMIDLLAIATFFYLINILVFQKELRMLKRSSKRIPFARYSHEIAKGFSTLELIIDVLACLGFLWITVLMAKEEATAFSGRFLAIVMSLLTISSMYLLYVKMIIVISKGRSKSNDEA